MNDLIPIIVLDDGETYSGVDGACICLITLEDHEKLVTEELDVEDLDPVFELGLRDFTMPGREPIKIKIDTFLEEQKELTPEEDSE